MKKQPTSKYSIAILLNVFDTPEERVTIQWETDDRARLVEYDTLVDAITRRDELDAECYVTHSYEAGRPEYVILDDTDAEYVRNGRNGDMSNYDWEDADCECGDCRECREMMQEQDRDWISEHEVG